MRPRFRSPLMLARCRPRRSVGPRLPTPLLRLPRPFAGFGEEVDEARLRTLIGLVDERRQHPVAESAARTTASVDQSDRIEAPTTALALDHVCLPGIRPVEHETGPAATA